MRKWILVTALMASPAAWAQTAPSHLQGESAQGGRGPAGGILEMAYAQDAQEANAVTNPITGCGEVMAENATPKSRSRTRAADANRFYMEQNGKQMTARDFDAWMKSRGIRVATGKPKPAPKRKRGD